MSKPFLLPALLATTLLAGCAAPMVLGAAATAGYVGLQERSVGQTAQDTDLKLRIKSYLTQTKYEYLTDVGIDVFYSDVLITGIVPTQADGEKVVSTAQRTQGVRKVYNELFVGAEYSTAQKAKDAWIVAQIQPRLIGTQGVFPLNYIITVVNSHAYIIGSCQTAEERNHVLHLLRTTRGITQVHDYLIIEGDSATDGRTNVVKQETILDTGTRRAPNPFEEDPLAH